MYNRTSYSSHQSTITFYQLIIQVWEQDELSSGSEEALRHSNDSLRAPSAAEEMSTDDSGVQLNVIGRSKPKKSTHPRDTGCLPSGYIPQVSTLYYHKVIRTRVITIWFSNCQLICAAILSLGNFNIGFTLAYHGLAPANHLPANSPSWAAPWVLNLFNLGGLLGALLSSLALNKGNFHQILKEKCII